MVAQQSSYAYNSEPSSGHNLDRKFQMKKPMMEKRRRARINKCLNELKSLLLARTPVGANSHPTKLEKADILEMTVNYINQTKMTNDTTLSRQKFLEGYNLCVQIATQFLSASSGTATAQQLHCALLNQLGSFSARIDSATATQPPFNTSPSTSPQIGGVHKPLPIKAPPCLRAAPPRGGLAELFIGIPEGAKLNNPGHNPSEPVTPPYRMCATAKSRCGSLDWNQLSLSPYSSSTASCSETNSISPFSSRGSMSPTTPATPGKDVWRPW